MEPESGNSPQRNPSQLCWVNLSRNLLLAYQSFGVVYGDLSISPLYVYKSVFIGKLRDPNPEAIFGAFSLIFWTLTLIPLLKYVFILLSADDNGEGGTIALYSLLCRHAKFSLLPNQQAADEELSCYRYGPSADTVSSSSLRRFLEKHKKSRTTLLVVVLLAACMVIGDGVITPAMAVLASVSGLETTEQILSQEQVLLISCCILVGLFALQHCGTHKVAVFFAPVVIVWLILISLIGLYNIFRWNPKIIFALSPHYIINYFRAGGKDGWISLGGVLLCVTGTEAMFADLGHFTATSIRLAFTFVVYPCLVVQYMGQAAFLSKNTEYIPNSFYASIPESVFWPVFVLATLASIVGSQAIITATFSIIKQCHAIGCFPRVKIVHTSKHIYGQIYIPEINWILMIVSLALVVGFRDTAEIGNAYGLACMTVMFITTFLMALVIVFVWRKNVILAAMFFQWFGILDSVLLYSALMKVPQGGWVSLAIASIFMIVMFVWHYGTLNKYKFDAHNKASLKWILGLGPSLGIVRVPGIGLVYSELATGVPAIFSHLVTNLPAIHNVLVFVCVKTVPVPFVSAEERFLVGRVCPRPYRMYRCIVRYGYKDIQRDEGNFENRILQSIAEFIQMDSQCASSPDNTAFEGRMAVMSSIKPNESNYFKMLAAEQEKHGAAMASASDNEDDEVELKKNRMRFELQESSNHWMDPYVREELMELIMARETGVAYIVGHSYIKARRSSSFLKKIVIDIAYSFLRKNCRGPGVALSIPHISLIEVGMIYYV